MVVVVATPDAEIAGDYLRRKLNHIDAESVQFVGEPWPVTGIPSGQDPTFDTLEAMVEHPNVATVIPWQ
jgi:hypothetical protein